MRKISNNDVLQKTSALVSIVLAAYNGEKFLREQIESILNQSYKNLEIIVVDDGSRDATLSIVNEYAAQDSRIKLYPADQNLGFVKNFERGLRIAKGEYIFLSDQDDIFVADKVVTFVTTFQKNSDCDLIISDLELINDEGRKITDSMWHYKNITPREGMPFHYLIRENFATGCAMAIKRRVLNRAIPFPNHLKLHDQWLAIVATSHGCKGIKIINEPLTKYRQHTANVIGAKPFQKVNITQALQSMLKTTTFQKFLTDTAIAFRDAQWRVFSYLERKDLWSKRELDILNKLNNFYIDILYSDRTLISKISTIPRVINHCRYFRHPVRVFFRLIILNFSNSLFHKS